jgi:hypothetical protein
VLGLFVIPYFMAFSWIDDKRSNYVKDESMYPQLQNVGTVVQDR